MPPSGEFKRKILKITSGSGSMVAIQTFSNFKDNKGKDIKIPLSNDELKRLAVNLVKTWVKQNGPPSKDNEMYVRGKNPMLKAFLVLATKDLCSDMKGYDTKGIQQDSSTKELLSGWRSSTAGQAYKAAKNTTISTNYRIEFAHELAEDKKSTNDLKSVENFSEKLEAQVNSFRK